MFFSKVYYVLSTTGKPSHRESSAWILFKLLDENLTVTMYIMADGRRLGTEIRGIKFPSSEFVSLIHTVTHMVLTSQTGGLKPARKSAILIEDKSFLKDFTLSSVQNNMLEKNSSFVCKRDRERVKEKTLICYENDKFSSLVQLYLKAVCLKLFNWTSRYN